MVQRGGAHKSCSDKRNRSKSHIIFHSTAKFAFAAKQLFTPTTDFAGNTLWSFITPWSFHLRTRWPSPTSLLLLSVRFRSTSRSPGCRTTPTPTSKSGHLSTKTLHHYGNHLCLHGKQQSQPNNKPVAWGEPLHPTTKHIHTTTASNPNPTTKHLHRHVQSRVGLYARLGPGYQHTGQLPCLEIRTGPHHRYQRHHRTATSGKKKFACSASGCARRTGCFGRNLLNSDAVRHGTVHPDAARHGTVCPDAARHGICLLDGACQGIFLLDAAVSGHFPSGHSRVRAFSFWMQLCQGKWRLDDTCHGTAVTLAVTMHATRGDTRGDRK